MARGYGWPPSNRNIHDEQPEVCELCGGIIGHRHLREADVEGLRGRMVCSVHPFEARTLSYPSLNDYRSMSPGPFAPEAGQRLEPIGADLWYEDSGAIEREDGGFLLREDGGFFHREI